MPCGPAANSVVGVERGVAQDPAQEVLVGPVDRGPPDGAAVHRRVQRREHPPHRSALGDRRRRRAASPARRLRARSSSASVMSARSSWPVAGSTCVASSVSGFSATSTTASTSSVCERGPQAVRLRERGQRVPAGDEQRADVAGLDLVDERDRRDLPDHARELGPARRLRARRARRGSDRAAGAGWIEPAVEVHAAGAVERARRDQHDPAQPLGEHAVARHRHAGAAVHRDAARARRARRRRVARAARRRRRPRARPARS